LALTATPFEDGKEVGFDVGEGGIQHFPPRHDDDVEARRDFVAPEQFSGQPLCPVAYDGGTQFAGRRHADSRPLGTVGHREDGHEPTVYSNAGVVGAFELGPATDPLRGGQPLASRHYQPSSETVRRLRPFWRRRFNTVRPFLVAMRTRKPCVFDRRRVFGWNVRLPFFDLAMLSYTKEWPVGARAKLQY
jgi:hypothetical protein